LLELERLGRQAELKVRRAVEPRANVLQVPPEGFLSVNGTVATYGAPAGSPKYEDPSAVKSRDVV
jgi:hypothetical protein